MVSELNSLASNVIVMKIEAFTTIVGAVLEPPWAHRDAPPQDVKQYIFSCIMVSLTRDMIILRKEVTKNLGWV